MKAKLMGDIELVAKIVGDRTGKSSKRVLSDVGIPTYETPSGLVLSADFKQYGSIG